MRALIICEDFTYDQYILRPIVKRMLTALGKPRIRVDVSYDPQLGGVDQALDWRQIAKIIDRHRGVVQLFILCVDRDGQVGRRQRLDNLEKQAQGVLRPNNQVFFAVEAWQEIEAWLLAGQTDLPHDWNWQEIRQETQTKELYYIPYAQRRAAIYGVAQGRQRLAEEAARNYGRIRQLCDEVRQLEAKIAAWLEESA